MLTTGANPEKTLVELLIKQKGASTNWNFGSILSIYTSASSNITPTTLIDQQKSYTQSMQQRVGEYYQEKQK